MAYRRVIVVGLDGLEPSLVDELLASQELPSFERLRQRGRYARVATTTPAQTPVAWSTFATGVNPGRHGIFDFVGRDPLTYRPTYALNHYEQKNPFLPPQAVNDRQGTTLWEHLSDCGVPSVVLRCPCNYPPPRFHGKLLAGMGVPDVRGSLGTSCYLTTRSVVAGESESVVLLHPIADGKWHADLPGPLHPRTRKPTVTRLNFQVTARHGDATEVTVQSEGGPGRLTLRTGVWSEWLTVKFSLGMLQSMRGMVRFHLRQATPEVELLASPVNFLPDAPPHPISWPPEYAGQLANRVGRFHTTGMVEEHTALSNGRIDKSAYLDQCEQTWAEREAMLLDELHSQSEGLFFCLFDTPDRVQHMFWKDHQDSLRTGRDGLWGQAVREQYRRCDALLQKLQAFVDDPETLVVVLSDHGFGSFDRSVHLNSWLHDQGLLKLKHGISPGEAAGDLLQHVEWSETKAYALGLSGIYLNRRDRESHGVLSEPDAESLRTQICTSLSGLVDTQTGSVGIRSAVTRETRYQGPLVEKAPDVLVNYARGYRASWETAMGGIPGEWFGDNTRAWSGDHIVDPALVPGVLFMNRDFCNPARGDAMPHLMDLAPSLCDAFGVPRNPQHEGESLLA